MSEFTHPDIPGETAVACQALTGPKIDALLADFRSWLEQAAAGPLAPELPEGPDEAVDLFTLVGQFVALRQEVNLQTRSSRVQQEQNADTLQRLGEALDVLQTQSEAGPAEVDQSELLRPLLKAVVDAHDALALACREVERAQNSLQTARAQNAGRPAGDGGLPKPPFWAQFLGLGHYLDRARFQEERYRLAAQALERAGPLVNSMATGYTMSLQRLQRCLDQHGLEPIPALGQPFDPETMEVVEVVHEPGRSGTQVIDEVRRGYFWRGRVFRFAQVRVSRGN